MCIRVAAGIPMCTLRSFPSLVDHCIEWARALFTDLFVAPVNNALKLVREGEVSTTSHPLPTPWKLFLLCGFDFCAIGVVGVREGAAR